MTREEHIKWCKERALHELEFYGPIDGPRHACISIMSDLGKHPETVNHAGIKLTSMLMLGGHLQTKEEVIRHIEGFN